MSRAHPSRPPSASAARRIAIACVAALGAAAAHAQFAPSPTPIPATFPVGITFHWLGTATAARGKRVPNDPARYTITFEKTGRAAIRLDCSNGNARWAAEGNALRLTPIAGTKKQCDYGSLDVAYATDLGEVGGWRWDGRDLVLVGRDGSAMLFAPKR